jgi:hypothetical protein
VLFEQVINTPELVNPPQGIQRRHTEMSDVEKEEEVDRWMDKALGKDLVVLLVVRCDQLYTKEEFVIYKTLKKLISDTLVGGEDE